MIVERFMNGELDASAAAAAILALPGPRAEYEYLLWPEGTWSRDLVRAKIEELGRALSAITDDSAA